MRTIKEGHLYQLTFMPRLFPINCYFVEEEDGLTLIDAALPYSVTGIVRAAERIGKPIARIVLTHAHDDHVGALDELKRRLPDVPVFISRRDARLMAGDRSLDRDEEQTPIKGGVPKSLKTRADRLLEDGDRIGHLLAVSVPGHTPGSMAFYDSRNGALIAGDAFQVRGGLAISGQLRIRFPFPAFATWSGRAALESAKRIEQLKPTLLAVGHGNLLHRPGEGIRRVIAEAERNEQKRK